MLIVIDSSGSMSGGRIDMAISAAKKVGHTLTLALPLALPLALALAPTLNLTLSLPSP